MSIKQQSGFTIVELLIVIVVIAILAAIGIVAYTGVQNRAHDSAVQQDLRQLGQQIELYRAANPALPTTGAMNSGQIEDASIQLTKGSYSEGFISNGNGHNVAYCRNNGQNTFALVAWSRSDTGYAYINGSVQEFDYTPAAVATTCPRAEVSGGERTWLYAGGNWRF